jgi:hypothetical protein
VLENDEDMLGLLLTEKAEAAKRGQVLSMSKHENVELLIEEYARQCGSILLEVDYLLKRVEDKKVCFVLKVMKHFTKITFSSTNFTHRPRITLQRIESD